MSLETEEQLRYDSIMALLATQNARFDSAIANIQSTITDITLTTSTTNARLNSVLTDLQTFFINTQRPVIVNDVDTETEDQDCIERNDRINAAIMEIQAVVDEVLATSTASISNINSTISNIQAFLMNVQGSINGKENIANKTSDILNNNSSTVYYPNTKGVADYIANSLSNYVTNISLANNLNNYVTVTTLANYITDAELALALSTAQTTLTFNNGIRNLNNIVTPVYGNTANTICEGNDARLAIIGATGATGPTGATGSIGVTGPTGYTDEFLTLTRYLMQTTNWQDCGINGGMLETGSYLIRVYANDLGSGGNNNNEYYTGVMSWYSGGTNSSLELPTDEIVLHRAGGGSEGAIYLRTFRTETNNPDGLKLQIYSNTENTSFANYVFTFRRFI